jgi:hypothetical protein
MGAKRAARAAVFLAAELQAELAELGVSVPADEIAGMVAPLAVMVADTEAAAERAVKDRDRKRQAAAGLIGKTARRIAGAHHHPVVTLTDFNPSAWQTVPVAAAPDCHGQGRKGQLS